MENNIKEEIFNAIASADKVLIGLGNELTFSYTDFDMDKIYGTTEKNVNYFDWMKPLIGNYNYVTSEQGIKVKEFYQKLYETIKDKEYYIVTQNYDTILGEVFSNRLVSPCGSITSFQCESCKNVWQDIEYYQNFMKELENKKGSYTDIKKPICPVCQKSGIPNVVSMDGYNESGYLAQWSNYTNWLQGTLNQRICILEIGVGFQYPTIIRWPFEKITFFNQKARLFRIHSKLHQISEELADRGFAVKLHPLNLF